MGSIASQAEVKFAIAFVKYLKGDWYNTFLLTAVVAWMRQESGGLSRVIGNNPFNIRPGMTSFLSNGVRRSRNGNGYFLTFASLERGAQAAAYLLMNGSRAYGYYLAVNAARRMNGGQQVGLDFLTALALSSWDAAHYGAPDGNPQKNNLVRVWVSITGLKMPDPEKDKPKAPKKKKPRPVPPRPLPPPTPASLLYIQPYDSRDFYRAKHRGDSNLPENDPAGRFFR